MSAELQDDTIIDIYNNAVSYMKSKDATDFSQFFFNLLESEDVDLDVLLDVSDNGCEEDNDFHKALENYLNNEAEDYDDEEDEEDF